MKYLTDTHALLWYFEDSPKLSDTIATLLEDSATEIFISVVSLWEFTIKNSLGKLHFEGGIDAFCRMIASNGIDVVNIKKPHLNQLSHLPFIHKDPFDRFLIATALAENMTLLTADKNIYQYDVKWMW